MKEIVISVSNLTNQAKKFLYRDGRNITAIFIINGNEHQSSFNQNNHILSLDKIYKHSLKNTERILW